MNLKPFEVKGVVRLVQRRLFVDGDECYGTAEYMGRRFVVRLSNIGIESVDEFMDTLVHELLHVYLGILMAVFGIKLSDKACHRIIEPTSQNVLRLLKRELRKRKRK